MIKKANKIIYGISEKKDGDMKLVLGEHNAETGENRREYFEKHRLGDYNEVAVEIVHGGQAQYVTSKDAGKIVTGIDGLVSNEPGLILAVTMADCLPVFFYNTQANIIGLAHAGWRGLRKGIIENMISELKKTKAGCINDMKVYIGPHIKDCHFEVQADVFELFEKIPGALRQENNKTYLNLAAVTKDLFTKQGIKQEKIMTSKDCTYCHHQKYFSFRRDNPKKVLAQMAYIVIKE